MPALRQTARRNRKDGFGGRNSFDWSEQQQLIGAGEVNEMSYLWLARPNTDQEEEPD